MPESVLASQRAVSGGEAAVGTQTRSLWGCSHEGFGFCTKTFISIRDGEMREREGERGE